MSCSLSVCVTNPSGLISFNSKHNRASMLCHSVACVSNSRQSKDIPILSVGFKGKPLVLADNRNGFRGWSSGESGNAKPSITLSLNGQGSVCVTKSMRWWEKTLKPNMVETESAQQLVNSLLNAGDRLVVVDFYSPGCGGCRALYPKICQLAESNPDAIFLKVNSKDMKAMCYALNVHVLPFFRFYRGAKGRVCSFSCTNATIRKFKDALAKYGADTFNPGPAKGLEESEILKLASIGELSINMPLTYSSEERSNHSITNLELPGLNWSQTAIKKDLQEETLIV